MHKSLNLIAASVALLAATTEPRSVSAQQTVRGTKLGDGSKVAAGPGGFEVVQPKLNRLAPRAVPLQQWEVNQDLKLAAHRRHLLLGVKDITAYSDSRMRWSFYIWNRGNLPEEAIFFVNDFSLGDHNTGESFKVLAAEFRPVGEQRPESYLRLAPGVKTFFWVDFLMPKTPTDFFNLHLQLNRNLDEEYPAFTIKLPTPIPLPTESERNQNPVETSDEPNTSDSERSPAPRPVRIATESTQKKVSQRAETSLRTLVEAGRPFRGSMTTAPNVNSSGGITFEKYVPGRLVKARFFINSPARRVNLTGAIVEDPDAKDGSALVMEDRDGMSYRFTLDGSLLIGEDSQGGRFVMHPDK